MTWDYAPWKGWNPDKPRLGKIHVSDIENACPQIISCISFFMWRHPKDTREFIDYFYRDVGCWTSADECPDRKTIGDIA